MGAYPGHYGTMEHFLIASIYQLRIVSVTYIRN